MRHRGRKSFFPNDLCCGITMPASDSLAIRSNDQFLDNLTLAEELHGAARVRV
jgi:hypothetical protein